MKRKELQKRLRRMDEDLYRIWRTLLDLSDATHRLADYVLEDPDPDPGDELDTAPEARIRVVK